ALALALLPLFGVELLPDFQESNVIIHMFGLPGTSLDTSVRAAREAERAIHGVEGVVSSGVKVGRAELGEGAWGPEQSERAVALDPHRTIYGPVLAEVRRRFAAFPGYVFSVKQFLRERIEEVISGSHGEVVLRIQGPDLETLRQEAERDARLMASVAGSD